MKKRSIILPKEDSLEKSFPGYVRDADRTNLKQIYTYSESDMREAEHRKTRNLAKMSISA